MFVMFCEVKKKKEKVLNDTHRMSLSDNKTTVHYLFISLPSHVSSSFEYAERLKEFKPNYSKCLLENGMRQ